MKKLSIIFSALAVFCFLTAGSAVAGDPPCGVFLLSPGTNTNTLDTYFQVPPGLPTAIASTPCLTSTWSVVNQPSTCQQNTTFNAGGGSPWYVEDIAKMGTTACKVPMLGIPRAYKTIDPNSASTVRFEDVRSFPVKTWFAQPKKSTSLVTVYYSGNNFTSSQTSICAPDWGATFNQVAFPAESKWWNVVEAEIISGSQGTNTYVPPEYTMVRFEFGGTNMPPGFPTVLPGTSGWLRVQSKVNQVSVEITKPRRCDLDYDGTPTLNDVDIFKKDYALGAALCGCPTYW